MAGFNSFATPDAVPAGAVKPASQPATARIVMVHVRDPRARWSVLASRVVRIVSAAEWSVPGVPALDLLARLGPLPEDDDERHRVVVLHGVHDRETAVIAAGSIQIVDVEPGDVLPLPVVFSKLVPEISAIVVARDASLSLVLDPLAIAPPPPSPTQRS